MLYNFKKYRQNVERIAYVDTVTGEMNIYRVIKNNISAEELAVHAEADNFIRCIQSADPKALSRWHHPKRGVIYPSDFIPLFEKMV